MPRPAAEVIAYALPRRWRPWSSIPAPALRHPVAADFAPSKRSRRQPAGYVAPTWAVPRKARRAARPHEVYAVDAPAGEPALAVICPDGTLDTGWAERLLAFCPPDTGIMALPVGGRRLVREVGRAR